MQHSIWHTHGWRAIIDLSLNLSTSETENLSVNDTIATERYIIGYACKGNESTGAVIDIFNDYFEAVLG